MAVTNSNELAALIQLSADLGQQKLLVQGTTGNTSVKIGHTLWIKASGKRLANALKEEMFVAVDFAEADKYFSAGLPRQVSAPGVGLMPPSIETAMHLTLPHRVVVHVHSVSAIAWAVQRECMSALCERLRALRWYWIRYVPSGAPLAKEIRASLRFSPDVFILANHGLVIGAHSCEAAKRLLQEVEKRLAIRPRTMPAPDLSKLEQLYRSSDFQLPDTMAIHSLATDRLSTAVVTGGILYPCQARLLGRRTPIVTEGDFIFRLSNRFISSGYRPPALLIKGQGVLVARDLTPSESDMLIGLAEVAKRLNSDARIAYLSAKSIDELLSNDSHSDWQLESKGAAREVARSSVES